MHAEDDFHQAVHSVQRFLLIFMDGLRKSHTFRGAFRNAGPEP